MPTYRSPDVYVEEISLFPPSVAEVETAIPAFVGYTEKAMRRAPGDLILKPTKVYSFKEFEQFFGFARTDTIEITVEGDAVAGFNVTTFEVNDEEPTDETLPAYLLYPAVKMYFDNGGGLCYIVSVGTYQATPAIDWEGDGAAVDPTFGLSEGIEALALEDEPTLIVVPEAAHLSYADYGNLVKAVLAQCGDLGDRFGIFDAYRGSMGQDDDSDVPVPGDPTAKLSNLVAAREAFGMEHLKYGAVYYPNVRTSLNYEVRELSTDVTNVTVTFPLPPPESTPAPAPGGGDAGGGGAGGGAGGGDAGGGDAGGGAGGGDAGGGDAGGGAGGGDACGGDAGGGDAGGVVVPDAGGGGAGGDAGGGDAGGAGGDAGGTGDAATTQTANLGALRTTDNVLYNFVKAALKERFMVMPPSGAVAGVYAATDTNRGVWKAPANVSLADVLEPVIRVDTKHQDFLNVDVVAGKSVNVIRSFAGKGTLVWGARTLAGNDNEWRYISVRRFFNMVEESVKKSTYWAVFEPNDANTWVKVRGMIENYLTQKWREGALAGATPKDAFFVKCGLGTTMSAQDILEGRMNVEIGMAVVRPAEFIVLKFSHKLQTS